MKTFKSFITESGVGPHAQTQSLDVDINPAALQNPKVLTRLNSFVGQVAKDTYVMPEDAVYEIREKLMRVGLQFGEVPEFVGESGSFSMPLNLFGGRFGKDENTPHDEFLNDDGISHNVEGGLSLNLTYEMDEANCFKMTAKIQ